VPEAVLKRQPSEAKIGGEAGIRTLRTRFAKLMMAKDFWQQVFAKHHVPAESLSARVSASLRESTTVLATSWQRRRSQELVVP
jgi:hypothetical protein